MTTVRPKIAITMGDPAGVGPELCLRLLGVERNQRNWIPVVVGDAHVMEEVARRLPKLGGRVVPIQSIEDYVHDPAAGAVLLHCPPESAASVMESLTPGQVTAATGEASYRYLMAAIELTRQSVTQAITTGPLHKEALHSAGIPFPGHTEILAHETATKNYCMMLTSEQITCSFVTTHVGYADVPKLLTTERILEVAELTIDAMWKLRDRSPRMVMCGLNPHAGENGLFGCEEEQRIIQPAVEQLRSRGLEIIGPVPPDTAFLPRQRAITDAYLCMYHDQGHIPVKALAFDEAVNVTLGLPIVRTSVDHGTAVDIAWKGVAEPSSFLHAIDLAARLASNRSVTNH